jgi:hypothetical protein
MTTVAVAIQLFLVNLGKVCTSLIRMLLLSRFGTSVPTAGEKKKCVILGNGPSLSASVQQYREKLAECALMGVNYLPVSDLYTELKPEYLMLAPIEFYRTHVDELYKIQRKELFDAIREKTTWPLHIFMPVEARKFSEWKEAIASNTNLRIHYFNNTPVEGFRWFRHLFFSSGSGMPRPHNVIGPSLMMAIRAGYKEIFLLGADHSWLPEISVDEENNVLVRHQHFYDREQMKGIVMPKAGLGKRPLHDVLYKFLHTFQTYHLIGKYSNSKGCRIVNATPGSFIDAFVKDNLD